MGSNTLFWAYLSGYLGLGDFLKLVFDFDVRLLS